MKSRAGLCVDHLEPLEGSVGLLLVPSSGEGSWDRGQMIMVEYIMKITLLFCLSLSL